MLLKGWYICKMCASKLGFPRGEETNKRKKSIGAKSREHSGWSRTVTACLDNNLHTQIAVLCGRCHSSNSTVHCCTALVKHASRETSQIVIKLDVYTLFHCTVTRAFTFTTFSNQIWLRLVGSMIDVFPDYYLHVHVHARVVGSLCCLEIDPFTELFKTHLYFFL